MTGAFGIGTSASTTSSSMGIGRALVRAGADPDTAAELFTVLLGELHRQRLLGLAVAPTRAEAAARAARVVTLFRP
ncbi:hypothetical protein N8D74_06225 [Curtobacterium flaccumfaciens]|uniref:Uncharacterized protein n=1 Tax=Curtobacterium poinsettiae TaxID=159612 RepID=A0A9Q9T453_9MICO|nr:MULTISPECIES: hypothetical protein [Curtobacterium]MBO9038279.1 hypothetical protein [Curtobacterium flaccumfaciens pv. flaccumfaciens]UXN26478.1 hypothetical protein N8D74_06225 [Curtobacterium flaccumfaciens]UYC81319.1 hypothetical protein OE229_02300 [Curtobacterium flaccumfaciens pv. poinsettiae]